MSVRWIRAVVLALGVFALLVSPAAGVADAFCTEEEAPECCATCSCCPHGPTMLADGSPPELHGFLFVPLAGLPMSDGSPADPREILHVPRLSRPTRS